MRNLIEDIEHFIAEYDNGPTKEPVAPTKATRAKAKSAEPKMQGGFAASGRLTDLLGKVTDATDLSVKDLDALKEKASDLSKQVVKLLGGDAEYGLRRSESLLKSLQDFSDAIQATYAQFAEGREAVKALASAVGVSTTRSAKEAPKGDVPMKGGKTDYSTMTADELLAGVNGINKKIAALIDSAAKQGRKCSTMAELLSTNLDGNKDLPDNAVEGMVGKFVGEWLDYRDMMGEIGFKLRLGLANRINEMLLRVKGSKIGAGIPNARMEGFDLDFLAGDEDFGHLCESKSLSEMWGGKGMVKMNEADRKMIREGACGYAKKLNEMTSDTIDEAGCAYGMMEALYEMYGEPDASYYGSEEPYVGEERSRYAYRSYRKRG
jgi:hypothetical protein